MVHTLHCKIQLQVQYVHTLFLGIRLGCRRLAGVIATCCWLGDRLWEMGAVLWTGNDLHVCWEHCRQRWRRLGLLWNTTNIFSTTVHSTWDWQPLPYNTCVFPCSGHMEMASWTHDLSYIELYIGAELHAGAYFLYSCWKCNWPYTIKMTPEQFGKEW